MTGAGYHAADDGSLARSTGGAAARGAVLIALALAIGLLLIVFALDDPQTEIVAADANATETTDDAAAVDDGTDDATVTEDASTDAATTDAATTDDAAAPEVGTPAEVDDPAIIPEVDEQVVDVPEEGTLLPPSEVNVLVANGTGGAGVASTVADKLIVDGYTAAVSNAPATAAGVIFYQPGFSANATAIASILGAAPDVVTLAPAGEIAVSPEAIADGRVAAANVVVIVGTDNAVPPS